MVKRERAVASKQWSCSELKDGQQKLLSVKNEKEEDLDAQIQEPNDWVKSYHSWPASFFWNRYQIDIWACKPLKVKDIVEGIHENNSTDPGFWEANCCNEAIKSIPAANKNTK